MKAIKGNKVYRVNNDNKENYKKDGFDIYDDNGKMLEVGISKTISYEEYQKVKDELEKIKKVPNNAKELKLKLDELTSKNEELQEQLNEANSKIYEHTKTNNKE